METKIFDYGMNGEGVAKIDGKIVLIDNALQDEVVDISIANNKNNFAYGKINKIVACSKERVSPKCPYFTECGGCDLQHMSYVEQLKFKKILIKKTIKKICSLDVDVNNAVECSQNFGYRNKVSFDCVDNIVGFYKKNSKTIIEINECLLINKNLNKILKIFKNYLKINEKSLKNIKNLVIREINSQILVGIVCKIENNFLDFFDLLKKEFNKIGLYQIINTRKDSVVLSGTVKHVAGIKEIEVENFNIKYKIDLLSFHQTNLDIQNKLYSKILNYITPNGNVVNGFSGQGLLSAILATKAKNVVGIEINKSAHKSAENLKKLNKINNLTNILGDFNKKIENYKSTDLLILDPSKKGCGKSVMEKIIGVKEIIYISCNPIAMCKDINFIKHKYDILDVTPFDMFPNTKNVETVVRFRQKEI